MSNKLPGTDISAWLKSTERQVRAAGDSTSALLRCRFDASPERIWAACTDRDQLRRWFAAVDGDMREGATLTFDVGAPNKLTSRIIECKPLRKLLITWSYPGREIDKVELTLTADRDAVLAELEHRSADKTEWWLGAGSGWEYALIRLDVLLRGDDPSKVSAEELDQKLGPLWTAAGRACA
jgi:uncharacterized protein YndB with AHSA1/START domain